MTDFSLRPLTVPERKYTYAQSSQLQGQTGNIGYLRADRQYTWTFAIEKDSIKLIGTEGNPEWESDGEEEIEAEPVI